ncbi:hypothetical protein [Fundidesulfovibrio agrisoli]|nr:hypothetical protein [Fundidesulfovibrio agrisoli]
MEIRPEQRRKLDLVAAHRKADVESVRDAEEGLCVAVVRKR